MLKSRWIDVIEDEWLEIEMKDVGTMQLEGQREL